MALGNGNTTELTNDQPVRILIADDHKVVLEALKCYLDAQNGVRVVGIATDCSTALKRAEELQPDIVLLDVTFSEPMDGAPVARQLRKIAPATSVIAFSAHQDRRFVAAMVAAGVKGYVVKAADAEELLKAISVVRQGEFFFSRCLGEFNPNEFLTIKREFPSASAVHISPTETQIISLIARGMSSKEIAAQFSISTRTVEKHRENISRKLGVHSTAEVVQYAMRCGLAG